MSDAARFRTMTVAEYLRWEREQTSKHEYHRGEVFLMARGSPRHNSLANAIGAELRGALQKKECHVLSSDQRIAAEPGERYVYADAVVVCGSVEMEAGGNDVLTNPSIVVEVLSRGTEKYDRGDKWQAYQQRGSLTDYVLVAQRSVRVEHFQREPDGTWRYRVLGPGETLVLGNGATVSIDAVYGGAFELPADDV